MDGHRHYLVYQLHFDRPYWQAGKARCQHYVGYTKRTVDERMAEHQAGKGSKLVAYALRRGIDFRVVLVEVYTDRQSARAREQQIKRNSCAKRLCPICQSEGGRE